MYKLGVWINASRIVLQAVVLERRFGHGDTLGTTQVN